MADHRDQETPSDVLFLAEAFTRPARLYGLARLGFTQSYTYFTWKTARWELEEFGNELAAHADEARPNLFVNTPDILHESLQHGGPGMFALRAALAATLSPTWGVYSGYELYEHLPVREAARSTSIRRSTNCAHAITRRPRPEGNPWNRGSPRSTRSGVVIRLCSSCATSPFTTSRTRR